MTAVILPWLVSFVLTNFDFLSPTIRLKTTSGQNCEAEEGKKTEEEGSKDGEDLPWARYCFMFYTHILFNLQNLPL